MAGEANHARTVLKSGHACAGMRPEIRDAQPAGEDMTASPSERPSPWGANVLVEFEDGIAWVSLNRPDKRNAMNPPLTQEMLDTIDALETDDRCGVLVLTGAGDAFSAGMDLKEYFRANQDKSAIEWARIKRVNANWQWRRLMYYPQADDRHGQRLVLRRRLHAAGLPATSRSRPRRRSSGCPRSTGASSRAAS